MIFQTIYSISTTPGLQGLRWDFTLHLPSSINRLKPIDLPTFEKRREMLRVIFIFKLMKGNVFSPALSELINIHVVNRVSRLFVLLQLTQCRTNYGFRVICKMLLDLSTLFVNKIKNILLIAKYFRVLYSTRKLNQNIPLHLILSLICRY